MRFLFNLFTINRCCFLPVEIDFNLVNWHQRNVSWTSENVRPSVRPGTLQPSGRRFSLFVPLNKRTFLSAELCFSET